MKKTLALVLLTASLNAWAEDENFEFDMDFNIKGKSTIEDFPLQEVDSQELSNAVIEGALQKTSAGSREVNVKSAHAEQLDKEGKEKDSELSAAPDKKEVTLEEWQRVSNAMIPEPAVRMPVFQEPNGRVYGLDHQITPSGER
jgi:predicted outer membrane protein